MSAAERAWSTCSTRRQGEPRRLARVETSPGARTALFVPELDRLFVAARSGSFGGDAKISCLPRGTLRNSAMQHSNRFRLAVCALLITSAAARSGAAAEAYRKMSERGDQGQGHRHGDYRRSAFFRTVHARRHRERSSPWVAGSSPSGRSNKASSVSRRHAPTIPDVLKFGSRAPSPAARLRRPRALRRDHPKAATARLEIRQ